MTGRGVRTFIRITAAAILIPGSLTAVRAGEVNCRSSILAAVALSNPLDRSEEPAVEIVCGKVAPAVPERHAIRHEQGDSREGVVIRMVLPK